MKIDELGCLITEAGPYPGNIGDSCADSARDIIIQSMLNKRSLICPDISRFRTNIGYVRHPNAPDGPPVSKTSWRESDFSSDQGLPLLMAYDLTDARRAEEMRTRLHTFKTGNGDLISPGLFSVVFGFNVLLGITLLIQSLIFLFPYRWSDSTNWVEKSENSSADYLNWFIALAYLHLKGYSLTVQLIKLTVTRATLISKIRSYFKPEPNSSWLVNDFIAAINKIY
jgi:hypothetical protein